MDFQNKNKYISLFDFYQRLLTKKQRDYFTLHFIEDYSLSEIANLKSVSRNAIYDSIDKIITIMNKLENELHLYLKNSLREEIYEKYLDKNKELIEELKKIDLIDENNN